MSCLPSTDLTRQSGNLFPLSKSAGQHLKYFQVLGFLGCRTQLACSEARLLENLDDLAHQSTVHIVTKGSASRHRLLQVDHSTGSQEFSPPWKGANHLRLQLEGLGTELQL